MNTLIHDIANVLNARKSGNSYVAICPICDQRKYTLNIWLGEDGRIGLRCYYSILGRCHSLAHIYYLQSLGVDIDRDDLTGSPNPPSTTWNSMWAGAIPALDKDSYVEEYLFRRGIELANLPPEYLDNIRCIPKLKHPSGPRLPAMICLLRNGLIDTEQAIHRTYLNPLGTDKATVVPNKMTLGPAKGGVVKFGQPVNGVIAVGEGIETCLSAHLLFGVNVWAATSVANLLMIDFPDNVKEVMWLVDNDEPGTIALANAVKKYSKTYVRSVYPSKGYNDFNDELRG